MRLEAEALPILLKASGTQGLFVRVPQPLRDDWPIIWLQENDLSTVLRLASRHDLAVGLAEGKGRLGIRVAASSESQLASQLLDAEGVRKRTMRTYRIQGVPFCIKAAPWQEILRRCARLL